METDVVTGKVSSEDTPELTLWSEQITYVMTTHGAVNPGSSEQYV